MSIAKITAAPTIVRLPTTAMNRCISSPTPGVYKQGGCHTDLHNKRRIPEMRHNHRRCR
jgi:hypothetical protein